MLSFCSGHLSVLTNLAWPLSFTPLLSFLDTFGIFTGQTELSARLFVCALFGFCLGFSLEGLRWNLLNKQFCLSVLLDDIREGKILFHMLNKESKFTRCELYSHIVDPTPLTLFVNLAGLSRQVAWILFSQQYSQKSNKHRSRRQGLLPSVQETLNPHASEETSEHHCMGG